MQNLPPVSALESTVTPGITIDEESTLLSEDIIPVPNVASTLMSLASGGPESQVGAVGGTPTPRTLISGLISGISDHPEFLPVDTNISNGVKKYGALLQGRQDFKVPDLSIQSVDEANLMESGLSIAQGVLSWPFELFNLIKKSTALMASFLLQYSLTLVSVLSAGHLGKDELAAVSLATMVANLTGYVFYQALCTAQEKLSAQSYGAGMHTQVGLHFQRCVILLMLISIPIGSIWLSSSSILHLIVPDIRVADLAAGYLQILFLGAPGHALFEAGKRYMQVQGINHASTAVLAFLAPLNAGINFVLVWDQYLGLGLGFYGAPVAIVISNWLMPIGLAYYAIFIEGSKCWHPLTFQAFTDWVPILKLAIPEVITIESQLLGVESLTLFSSYFGTSTLAAQSILITMTNFISQLPSGMSMSSCTAVAQYIDAGNIASARRSSFVAMGIAIVFGLISWVVLSAGQGYIGWIFSGDPEVIAVVIQALPVCAAFIMADVLANVTRGILKGQGRQWIAHMIHVPAYYGLALPVSLYTSFKLDWGIRGLWAGSACALVLTAVVQTTAVLFGDWEQVVKEAGNREAGDQVDDSEDGERERLLNFSRG